MDYANQQHQPQQLVPSSFPLQFSPTKRDFLGMALFFLLPIGFPLSFYIASMVLGYFFPTPALIGLTALIMGSLIPFIVFYIYVTNCTVILDNDQIVFRRIFPPYLAIDSIDLSLINSITINGIGNEQQISSDKKWITVDYNNQQKSYRCDGYINPSIDSSDEPPIAPQANFQRLRTELQRLCQQHNISYTEQ